MTDKELMQQALEALKQSNTKAPFGADGVVYWEGVKTHEAAITALRERLAQPEQEPVAWRFRETNNKPWSISDDGYYISCKRDSKYIIEPLYTDPPQRTPLTEENARLIAAAPELLDALQGLLRGIFDGTDEANAAMLIVKARDAINKATGEKK